MRSSTAGPPSTAMPESIHTKLFPISPVDSGLIPHPDLPDALPVEDVQSRIDAGFNLKSPPIH